MVGTRPGVDRKLGDGWKLFPDKDAEPLSGLLWAEDFPATSVLVFGYWAGQSHLEGIQVELLLLLFSLIFFVDGPQNLGHLLVVVLPSLGGPLIPWVWFAIATFRCICRNTTVLLRLLSVNNDQL